MTLTPAYGRDYKSKADVMKDFESDKDFEVNDVTAQGQYTNRAGLVAMKVRSVTIRYARLTRVAVVKVG
jgi:hypothetical protein